MEKSWLICDLRLCATYFDPFYYFISPTNPFREVLKNAMNFGKGAWNPEWLKLFFSATFAISFLVTNHTCIMAQAILVWIYFHDSQSTYIVLIFNGDLNYCFLLRWFLKWLWQQWCRVYLVEQIQWKLMWICRSWAEWCLPAWVFSLHWAWHTCAMFK